MRVAGRIWRGLPQVSRGRREVGVQRRLHASRRCLEKQTSEMGAEGAEKFRAASATTTGEAGLPKAERAEGKGVEEAAAAGRAEPELRPSTWSKLKSLYVRSQNWLTLLAIGGVSVWGYFNQDFVKEKISLITEPSREKLLPDPVHYPGGKPMRTLVIELDDTLVHSMWSRATGWRITKRPGVEAFLAYLSSFYEIVLFTSQLPSYADPVLDKLDPNGYIMHRLYTDGTKYINGVHVKDISKLNRDPARTLIIDTDPLHFQLQPQNGVLIPKWDQDPSDRVLIDLIPFLESLVRDDVPDVRNVISSYGGRDVAHEFALRRDASKYQTPPRYGGLHFGSGLTASAGDRPSGAADSPRSGEDASSGSLLGKLRH